MQSKGAGRHCQGADERGWGLHKDGAGIASTHGKGTAHGARGAWQGHMGGARWHAHKGRAGLPSAEVGRARRGAWQGQRVGPGGAHTKAGQALPAHRDRKSVV